jgi:hypothetical protein
MSALEAIDAAKAAGVKLSLNDGEIVAEAPKLPLDVVGQLKAVRSDLMRVLVAREAAQAALRAQPPPDAPAKRWMVAMDGLVRFVRDWGDRAALLGWTGEELYRVPPLWSRIDLTGAALLVGDKKVAAVTEASIAIESQSGSRLKFRRIGREHLA